MIRKSFYTNIHVLFLSAGTVTNLLLAVVYRYINAGSPFLKLNELPGFYTQGWPIMLQTYVVLYFVYYSIRYFNKRYAGAPHGFERYLKEVLFVLLAGFAIMELFHWIFVTYMVVPEADMAFLNRKLKMIQTIDITFLIVIYAFMTSFRIFKYGQQKQLELLQWQRAVAQSEFEAAKNNLNPHFLFNSLNALSALVYVDADKAEAFIDKLSRSYRYLLEQKDKQQVPLQEELQFLQSFLYLTQQRFGNKLQVQLTGLQPDGWQLAPHALMIVFEYLLATNSMSTANPLRITLSQVASALHFAYSPQPKASANGQAEAQLQRLQEQYKYRYHQALRLEQHTNEALIHLPLLPSL